ncbi:Gfo/Idh/MocA family oxidoreductase [Paucibacter sp. B2R-40]|uniref:Gfo/Idh/MocA family protein n=1 Tax=Paucibacter sp. B2R-40 TaxID=2893554 RepID=UPI0021E4A75C|nr:Gfo/Idh/MocA family oxidoreductase [Paucibacter sp. B2R-40]MCV2352688.1 Gfo/Idh/MocA family oxidoreductase [Paucibacter sp. B2R-40]
MMRIAVIGLGDIAQKAYLPLLSRRSDIELVLCSRNAATLQALGRQYRIENLACSIEDLARFAPKAAFVHTATAAHVEVTSALLEMGVDVYLDKPIAYELTAAERLVALARARGRLLMLGFNRRCAPLYQTLAEQPDPHLVLLQKHRVGQPAGVREFIFDDFIHVVDTLRWLAPSEPTTLAVAARVETGKRAGLLAHVSVQFKAGSFTGLGLMNRDSGANEECLELMCEGSKWRVENLNQASEHILGREQRHGFDDWTPVLKRRGFEAIIEQFLAAVRAPEVEHRWAEDALQTHRLCEQIVLAIEQQGQTGAPA